MSLRLALGWACLFVVTLGAAPAAAEEAGKYREFTLGSTTASVFALTGSQPSALKTMHERPSVLQELVWRPRFSPGRVLPDVDPVREIVFSFSNDRLYRIAIYYDRTRTAGLTHDDMVLALRSVYGAPLAPTARAERRDRFEPADATMPIATWERGDTQVTLYWSDYRSGFGLLVRSRAAESSALRAAEAAVALDEREAPAREEARRKKEAEDLKAADERARATNKGAFRP